MLFENISFFVTAIIYFGIVLGMAVIFHEWGHFIVAKMCGAKVDRFAVGFGQTIIAKKWGETEYAFNWLPLGGYVKIRGMEPDDEITGAEYEFLQLAAWRRILIVLAGPFMNFVLAYFIFIFIYSAFGQPYTATTTLGLVPTNSIAWEMGLHEDDTITAINGNKVDSWNQINSIFSSAYSPLSRDEYFDSREFTLTVLRNGETLNKTGQIPEALWDQNTTANAAMPPDQFEGIFVTNVMPDGPAAQAGLEAGSVIKQADGQTFYSRSEWSDYISTRYEQTEEGEYKPVPIIFSVVTPDGTEKDVTVTPELELPAEDAQPYRPKASISIMYTGEISVKEYFIPELPVLGVAPKLPPVIGTVRDGSPADKAGLTEDSRIVEMNGKEIDDWTDVLLTIHDSINDPRAPKGEASAEPLEVTWMTEDNQMKTATIAPAVEFKPIMTPTSVKTGKEYAIAQIGVDVKSDRKYMGLVGASIEGWHKTVDMTWTMIDFLGRLFTGGVSPRLLGGPVAIAQLSAESGSWGVERLLMFIALLSANLGLINLFPLPPLDGGHIVFYTYEILRRKPITMQQMENFGKIGFVIIIPLMIFLLLNDLWRLDLFSWVAGMFSS